MIKKVRIISLILILVSISIILYFKLNQVKDIYVQNRIIDNIFSVDVTGDVSNFDVLDSVPIFDENVRHSNSFVDDYLGYIYIPKFNIKRLIKYDTDSNILNDGYVGLHRLSGDLISDDLIILAGHDVSNVFHKLHFISTGDYVYINTYNKNRKFVVYDSKVVSEYDVSSLINNRKNELLLITCTKHSGERLLVFLKEEV